MTSGSALWQTVFVSFAIVLILFEFIRGWRLGLLRQLARVGAVIAAYAAAIFGGRLLLPIARPFLRMPDAVIAILAGAVLALLVYSLIINLGRILFRRADQHGSASLRILSGFSGAVVGIFFGAFLVWLVVVSIRSLGAVANGQVQGEMAELRGARPQAVHAVYSPAANQAEKREEPSSVIALLARLKNSLELGPFGRYVKRTDMVPPATYDTLGKVGRLLSEPEHAERLLRFPGGRELIENPKVAALRDDPEIADLIARGRFFDLLQNQKILDAANDPQLVQQIKKFDFQRALDYAVRN